MATSQGNGYGTQPIPYREQGQRRLILDYIGEICNVVILSNFNDIGNID